MAFFQDIQISNFRGIKKLKIEGLQDINIFLGKNSVGKTSILESIFLLTGISNPILTDTVNTLRNRNLMPTAPIDSIKYLFHNIDLNNKPTFEANMSDSLFRKLSFSLISKESDHPLLPNSSVVASSNEKYVGQKCISSTFEIGKRGERNPQKFTSEFCIANDGNIKQSHPENYHEHLLAQFITSSADANTLTNNLEGLIEKGETDNVLTKIKLFDARINRLNVLRGTTYIGYEHIKEMFPISMCGDGLKKFLLIVSLIASGKNNILLIDEIENGLHFSAYPLLWRSIFQLANENNIQIMITTHSEEIIYSLSKTIEDAQLEKACLYTIAKGKEEDNILYSYRYSGDSIKMAMDNRLELRC